MTFTTENTVKVKSDSSTPLQIEKPQVIKKKISLSSDSHYKYDANELPTRKG